MVTVFIAYFPGLIFDFERDVEGDCPGDRIRIFLFVYFNST